MEQIECIQKEVLEICGHLAIDMKKFPLAYDILNKLLEKSPIDPVTLLLLSSAYSKNSEYTNIIGLLSNAVNTGSSTVVSDKRIWARLALSYYKLESFSEAMNAITQALILSGFKNVNPNLYILQCRIFLMADVQQYPLEAVILYFEKTLEVTQLSNIPSLHVEALLSRAQLFGKHGDIDRAIVDLNDAITILKNPEAKSHFDIRDFLSKIRYTYLYSATLHCAKNDSERSSRLLNEGIDLFPHTCHSVQPLCLARSVISCLLKGDLKQTMDLLILEQSNSPDEFQPSIDYMIGRILLQIDSTQNVYQAYEHYQCALNKDSTKPYIWISMGSIYLKLGQVNDALSAYMQAIRLLTESPEEEVSTASTSSMAQRITQTNLGALAWFGISQAYISSKNISSAIEPLLKSMQLLKENDSFLQITTLENLMKKLSANSTSESHEESLEPDFTIVDVPLQCLLDLEFFKDTDVFQVERRIEKELLNYIGRSAHSTNSSIPSSRKQLDTIVTNQSNDVVMNKKYTVDINKNNNNKNNKNKSNSDSEDEKTRKRSNKGIKIEKNKSTKNKNRKRTDIFRRACVSISKRSNNNKSVSSSDAHHTKHIPLQQSRNRSSSLSPSLRANSTLVSSPQCSMHSYRNGIPVHESHQNTAYTNPFYTQMVPINCDCTTSHIVQSVGFSPSPAYASLYRTFSDGSLRASFNNVEYGMPIYTDEMAMPQISNPLYHSQRPRFVAAPPSPSVFPILTAQQTQITPTVMGTYIPSNKSSYHP